MPVTLARAPDAALASRRERRIRRGAIADRGRRLALALVNNMPDAAVVSTQRQFVKLIEAAAPAFDVTLSLLTLASVARGEEARAEMAELYRPADLAARPADALVVTGAEPRAAALEDEPYWLELTALFDAARVQTHATLASCLAAHVWAHHASGVRRHRVARKFSGLYFTAVATPHPLTHALDDGWTPHSRWNGLDEAELTATGYVVLTRSAEAGVDMFARDGEHLFLGLQGHPEYDGDTLAREFRRDVARALQGAGAPTPPASYYAPDVEARLREHVAGVLNGREGPHLPSYAMRGPEPTWRGRVAATVAAWLEGVAARKTAAAGPTFARARFGG